jgi:hypothetical protein
MFGEDVGYNLFIDQRYRIYCQVKAARGRRVRANWIWFGRPFHPICALKGMPPTYDDVHRQPSSDVSSLVNVRTDVAT